MITATTILAILVEILFPLGLAWWFIRRYRTSWRLVTVGVLTFIGSQVLHIPALQGLTLAFQTGVLPPPLPEWTTIFNALVLGLLAGLFEETFRAIGYRLVRRARAWKDGVSMGIGHGGIESILVGLSVLATLVTFSMARTNPQSLNLPGVETIIAQADEFWAMQWYEPFAGAVERLAAISLHISFSVLVLQAFIHRNAWWYIAAVLWHALVDAVAVYSVSMGLNTWLIEAIMVMFGLIALWITLTLRRTSPAAAEPVPSTQQNNEFV